MAQAVILHTIEDVKHCLKHELHKETMLFSANMNVVYYLKYQCGVKCEYLLSWIEDGEYFEKQKVTLQANRCLLDKLDRQIAPHINQYMEMSIRYFEPLYGFVGFLQLSVFTLFQLILYRLLERYSFDTILLYDIKLGPLKSSLENFMATNFSSIDYQIVYYINYNCAAITAYDIEFAEISSFMPQYDHAIMKNTILKQSEKENINILLFSPVEKLKFLLRKNFKTNIYGFDVELFKKAFVCNDKNVQLILPGFNEIDNLALEDNQKGNNLKLLYNSIKSDFEYSIIQNLQILYLYKTLHEKVNIKSIFWENSPLKDVGALLLEYFMKNNTTQVVGIQTEAIWFGYFANHVASFEFKQCHDYLTYRGMKKDFDVIYPCSVGNTNIVSVPVLPCKNDLINNLKKNRKHADIAVWVGWSSHLLLQSGSMVYHVEEQEQLLEYLNSIEDKKVHIVLEFKATFENCAILALMRKMKNITIIEDVKYDDYWMEYSPEVLIVDYTCLNREIVVTALHEKVPVIFIKDSLWLTTDTSLIPLEKQLYCAKKLEDVKRLLGMYFVENLKGKQWDDALVGLGAQVNLEEIVLQYIDG